MERDITFEVKDAEDTKFHVVSIDLPQHVVEECADNYLKILLQGKYRGGKGEYGKIKIGGREFEFTERILYKKDLERFKDIIREREIENDKGRLNREGDV